MKYDVQLRFTTDNSVMWVGVFLVRTGKDLGTHRLTCDELAEWLLARENESEQKGDDQMPNGGINADRDENEELRVEITKLEARIGDLKTRIEELEIENEELETRIEELKTEIAERDTE